MYSQKSEGAGTCWNYSRQGVTWRKKFIFKRKITLRERLENYCRHGVNMYARLHFAGILNILYIIYMPIMIL